MLAFRIWLNDRSLLSELPLLLTCALVPAALAMAALEIQVRVLHRSKRTLQLKGNHISISPAKYARVGWKQISAWRFHPVDHDPQLTTLTMEYTLGKKAKWRREWPLVLSNPQQVLAVVAELEQHRKSGSNTAPVIHLTEPNVPKISNRRLHGTVLLALAWWLLVHGTPLLGVGLLTPLKPTDPSASTSRFNERESAKIQKTAVRFFSSANQLRIFMLVAGGGMTALGGGFYVWALSKLTKGNSERPIPPSI